jgi:hypothetical protein
MIGKNLLLITASMVIIGCGVDNVDEYPVLTQISIQHNVDTEHVVEFSQDQQDDIVLNNAIHWWNQRLTNAGIDECVQLTVGNSEGATIVVRQSMTRPVFGNYTYLHIKLNNDYHNHD